MKCPSCGADSSGKYCEYCGSEMPYNGPQSVQNSYKTENVTHVTNVYYVNPNEIPPWDQPAQNSNAPVSAPQTAFGYNGNPPVSGQPAISNIVSPKDKSITLLLCFFLGLYGGHLFYVGRWKKGLLYFFTGGLFAFGWLIDMISIGTNKFRDSDNRIIIGKAKTAWLIIIASVIIMFVVSLLSNSQ